MGFWDKVHGDSKPWQREHDDSDQVPYTADQIVAYAEDDWRDQQALNDEQGTSRFSQWFNGGMPHQQDEADLDEYLAPLDGHEDQEAIRDALKDRLGLV